MVGNRDVYAAYEFMKDLQGRLANRVQLTTDGHAAYLQAVEATFGNDIDFAQIVKIYGESSNLKSATARRNALARKRKKSPATPT